MTYGKGLLGGLSDALGGGRSADSTGEHNEALERLQRAKLNTAIETLKNPLWSGKEIRPVKLPTSLIELNDDFVLRLKGGSGFTLMPTTNELDVVDAEIDLQKLSDALITHLAKVKLEESNRPPETVSADTAEVLKYGLDLDITRQAIERDFNALLNDAKYFETK